MLFPDFYKIIVQFLDEFLRKTFEFLKTKLAEWIKMNNSLQGTKVQFLVIEIFFITKNCYNFLKNRRL